MSFFTISKKWRMLKVFSSRAGHTIVLKEVFRVFVVVRSSGVGAWQCHLGLVWSLGRSLGGVWRCLGGP